MENPRLGDIVYYVDRGVLRPGLVVGFAKDKTTLSLQVFSETYCGSKSHHEVPYSQGQINGTWKPRD